MSTATIPEKSSGSDAPLPAPATSILIQDRIEIPLNIASLEDFRAWARSEAFPEQGRIDYIGGRIEVDLMIDNLFYHGSPKSEVQGIIWLRNRDLKQGRLFSDVTRVSNPSAQLSSEPDVVFLTFDSIKSGRVRYIRARDDDPDSYVEIEGSPDWICEIISDSSEQKDTVRLAERYFTAGVTEYWLVDARGESLMFQILTRGKDAFLPIKADEDGCQSSDVFQRRYRFSRERGPDNHWMYHLDEQPLR